MLYSQKLLGFHAILLAGLADLAACGLSVADYAPNTNVQCPDTTVAPLVRVFSPQTQSLHPQEVEYIDSRANSTLLDAWASYIGNGSSIGYDIYDIYTFSTHYPKIGIALSGGGHRAAQYGAGVLSALDTRNESSKTAGTGGLLQVTSYMSALSGGSWLASSLYFNEFPTIPDLVSRWLLDLDLILPGGSNIFSKHNQEFFGSVLWSVIAKAGKGAETSLTDPWSRALSFHFLNQTDRSNFFTNDSAHGAGQLFSQIPKTSAFLSQSVPFPLIVSASRPSGSDASNVSLDATIYEMTPFELASYDPSLSAGANMAFIGTSLSDGKPINDTTCVTGFDEVGFVMGTSSSLFNKILDNASDNLVDNKHYDTFKHILARLLQSVRTGKLDVANWPNPFNGIATSTFQDANSTSLELIDGGSNGEVVPLGSLLVKSREIDVIVAVDANANDNNFPNGESLLYTANRTARLLRDSHQQFPPIPATTDDFVKSGLNQRPTFFGCDPQQNPAEYPLVIYLPNSPPINGDAPVTNTNTFKLSYTLKHTQLFLDQVHANTIGGFTPNSNSPDPNWGKCLQCAAIDRSRLKVTPVVPRSDICSECFKQYCFNPQNPPNNEVWGRKSDFVDPDLQQSFFQKHKAVIIGGGVGVAVVLLGLIAACCVCCCRRRKVVYHKLNPGPPPRY